MNGLMACERVRGNQIRPILLFSVWECNIPFFCMTQQVEGRVLTIHWTCQSLDLRLSASRAVRNVSVCYKLPKLRYFDTAGQKMIDHQQSMQRLGQSHLETQLGTSHSHVATISNFLESERQVSHSLWIMWASGLRISHGKRKAMLNFSKFILSHIS